MLKTLLQFISLFHKGNVDYCLIGGLAMMLHNGRANTVDIDFYILVTNLQELRDLLQKEGIPFREAGEYQLQATVEGVHIDLLYADQYVGADVIHRAAVIPLQDQVVKVATPEDLIVLKTMAGRSIDLRDIEELRELYSGKLDEHYISKKLKKIKRLLK